MSMAPDMAVSRRRRILLFGGSFDPIHHGHLIVARHAAEALGIENVVLMPCRRPPHKVVRDLASSAARLELCRRAVAGDRLFDVSDWELTQDGPSYTINTIRHFRQVLGPEAELCWLIGLDSLHDLGQWRSIEELVELCRFITVSRSGPAPEATRLTPPLRPDQVARLLADVLASPEIDISSTDIRARVRAGRSIRYLVPDAVADFIAAAGLYRTKDSGVGGEESANAASNQPAGQAAESDP